MPKINDILKGLKVSTLVAIFLGLITVCGYTLFLAFEGIFISSESVGARLFFLFLLFMAITVAVGNQVRAAMNSLKEEKEIDMTDTLLSLEIFIIGGIGVTLILLSIRDLLNANINSALMESPIGVLTIIAAIQLWLAKTPKSSQHKLLNGSGKIVLMYVFFLAGLVPFTSAIVWFIKPEATQTWVYWIVFLLPATAGAWYIFRLPTSPRSKKLR